MIGGASGIGIGLDFGIGKQRKSMQEKPYIDQAVLDSLVCVISTYGKTNADADRDILKDKTGKGNDMRLLNFGFAEGSGYGLPGTDFEGWLCTDGVDDMIVSEKTVGEMIGDSKECTVISIINYISDIAASTNIFGRRYIRNSFIGNGIGGKYYICGYTSKNIDERGNVTVINDILGDKNDFSANYVAAAGVADYFSVTGYLNTDNVPQKCIKIAYAGGFIANKALTTDEINQIIAYFNLDRPGQIIKPQLYCNIKKQGITNDNHAEFNDQLIDLVGGHNIQLNNVVWEGESGIIDGALYLDGISDFGKATGLPILKDYTVVADREIEVSDGGIISKSNLAKNGAFIFEELVRAYSFGYSNDVPISNKRCISYQSKYSYNGNVILIDVGVDGDSMWLGTIRDGDSRFSKFALWSLMLFPYSLSEFLLERQLRKYKAGTLYPDMIEFRPIIKSNIPYSSISYSVNPGEYIIEGSAVTITITLSNETDKLVGVSSSAIADISISGDNGIYEITGKVTKSPQKIDIAIAEYIRYEDIVQPYPSMIDIYNSETDYKYTWGDTLKVGSKFNFKNFGYSLLPKLYETWFEIKSPNGGTLPIELNKDYEVYKGLAFVAHNTYKLDNNEPKCILSPSRLRIPNSGYKILGHIPDISGHGNHGVIHNSAYSGNSGANGQSTWILDDYDKNWLSYGGYFEVTDDSLIVKSDDIEFRIDTGHTFPGGEVEVTGMREGSYITIYGDTTSYSIRTNGRHSIPYNLESDQHNNYLYSEKCKGVVIKGVAEYEGAFCLDGVDDCIDIPTAGGKQVLMKTIWQSENTILYDQRKDSEDEFAIYSGDNGTSFPAYSIRNNGKTYIDGILNHYVQAAQLNNVCHNITITNELLNEPNPANPRLGANISNNHYAKMALYDFMLFDEISTDEKIRELNDVIGIEGGYVEKPEYYWDAHGKTNADPDRNTIKNRGTEQSLISNSSPTNLQTDWIANEFTFVNSASDVDIMSGDRLASTAYEARFLTGQVIPAMQVMLTLVNSAYDTFSYMYVDNEGTYQRIYFNDLVLNEPVTVDLPNNNNNNTNTGFILEANNPNAVINVKVLSQSVNIENAFDLEANNLAYTDESGYKENGLYLNGVDDSLVNPNVPALTDYTYIFKREILANDTINSVTMHKGLVKEFAGGFTVDYVIDDVDNFVYHSFGRGNVVSRKSVENSIIYGTTTSVNGITINRGSNTDDNGITIGKYASNYRKMVFYKEMLFSKTIDMLSINMLRNLFELDEIIDLNNKLFTIKKNEVFSNIKNSTLISNKQLIKNNK